MGTKPLGGCRPPRGGARWSDGSAPGWTNCVDDAEVHPGLLRGLAPRLEALPPAVRRVPRVRRRNAATPPSTSEGLLSNLGAKNAEAIAYLHDRDRQGLQKFIGQADWDHRPLLAELARQVGAELGEPDGVLVFDPSAFPKKGTASVGVQRQWCGRLGKLENCQVGVYLAYVSRPRARPGRRPAVPAQGVGADAGGGGEAGVPRAVRFRTRHELALEMLDERGPALPHGWVSGDDEMGRSSWFRRELRARGERYLLAVPSNTSVRDLAGPDPPYAGRGRRAAGPVRPGGPVGGRPAGGRRGRRSRCGTARRGRWWCRRPGRWSRPGPTTGRRTWPSCWWCSGSGRRTGRGSTTTCCRTPRSTPRLAEFARVFKAQHRVEECLKRAKGEAGLADYQVRTWEGWHHHQALSLVATWFLTQEARRGKKADPGADRPAGPAGDRASC